MIKWHTNNVILQDGEYELSIAQHSHGDRYTFQEIAVFGPGIKEEGDAYPYSSSNMASFQTALQHAIARIDHIKSTMAVLQD